MEKNKSLTLPLFFLQLLLISRYVLNLLLQKPRESLLVHHFIIRVLEQILLLHEKTSDWEVFLLVVNHRNNKRRLYEAGFLRDFVAVSRETFLLKAKFYRLKSLNSTWKCSNFNKSPCP